MGAAKTAAQRQAERKARELAAGRVQWKRWVHPDDVPALAEYADKLARKRARALNDELRESDKSSAMLNRLSWPRMPCAPQNLGNLSNQEL